MRDETSTPSAAENQSSAFSNASAGISLRTASPIEQNVRSQRKSTVPIISSVSERSGLITDIMGFKESPSSVSSLCSEAVTIALCFLLPAPNGTSTKSPRMTLLSSESGT